MSYSDGIQHAEQCGRDPRFGTDSAGHWNAECMGGHMEGGTVVPCGWEITGCESRAEAGAAFYGHDPRGAL